MERLVMGGNGDPIYLRLARALIPLHLRKSSTYGSPSDPFANFTVLASIKGQPRPVYAIDRAQEKLVRVYQLVELGLWGQVGDELSEIASLCLCAEAMREADGLDSRLPSEDSLAERFRPPPVRILVHPTEAA
jgi:hypothetical protein